MLKKSLLAIIVVSMSALSLSAMQPEPRIVSISRIQPEPVWGYEYELPSYATQKIGPGEFHLSHIIGPVSHPFSENGEDIYEARYAIDPGLVKKLIVGRSSGGSLNPNGNFYGRLEEQGQLRRPRIPSIEISQELLPDIYNELLERYINQELGK